jgi:hypothetical protein
MSCCVGKYVAEHLHCHDKSKELHSPIAVGKKDGIVSMLSSTLARKLERNRKMLKVIVLCCMKNMTPRGHTEGKKAILWLDIFKFRTETDLYTHKNRWMQFI